MNSDPGTSGVLSPYAKIDGLYFNPETEPDNFYYDLIEDVERILEEKGYTVLKCQYDNPDDMYNTLYEMEKKYYYDDISISGTSVTDSYELVINTESDMDDTTKPMNVALSKNKKKKATDEETKEEVEEKKEPKKRGRKKKSETSEDTEN